MPDPKTVAAKKAALRKKQKAAARQKTVAKAKTATKPTPKKTLKEKRELTKKRTLTRAAIAEVKKEFKAKLKTLSTGHPRHPFVKTSPAFREGVKKRKKAKTKKIKSYARKKQ